MADAVADTFRCKTACGGVLEIEWHHAWARVTTNKNGTTGWGKVISTSAAGIQLGSKYTAIEVGSVIRIHKCAFNPCTAQHPDAKYGLYGPPAHVYATLMRAEVAVEVPSIVFAQPPVVAQPPEFASRPVVVDSPIKLPPELAVVVAPKPAVVAIATPPLATPTVPLVVDIALPILPPEIIPEEDLPAMPVAAPLRCVPAAEPSALPLSYDLPFTQLCECPTAVAAAFLPDSTLAQVDVVESILHLARQIRQERHYVGYSFFILFGLLKKCRPMVWEGSFRIDLLETFVPWALDDCTRSCGIDDVCCWRLEWQVATRDCGVLRWSEMASDAANEHVSKRTGGSGSWRRPLCHRRHEWQHVLVFGRAIRRNGMAFCTPHG